MDRGRLRVALGLVAVAGIAEAAVAAQPAREGLQALSIVALRAVVAQMTAVARVAQMVAVKIVGTTVVILVGTAVAVARASSVATNAAMWNHVRLAPRSGGRSGARALAGSPMQSLIHVGEWAVLVAMRGRHHKTGARNGCV